MMSSRFLTACILACLSVPSSGCATNGQVYQQFGMGEDTFSLGWASYSEDEFGMIGSISQFEYDHNDLMTTTRRSARGLHLGMTRKTSEKVGVHFGFGLGGGGGGGGGFSVPSGGFVAGAHYFTDGGMILGLQNSHPSPPDSSGTVDSTGTIMFTVGFDDPFWILNPFGIFGTDEE